MGWCSHKFYQTPTGKADEPTKAQQILLSYLVAEDFHSGDFCLSSWHILYWQLYLKLHFSSFFKVLFRFDLGSCTHFRLECRTDMHVLSSNFLSIEKQLSCMNNECIANHSSLIASASFLAELMRTEPMTCFWACRILYPQTMKMAVSHFSVLVWSL